MKFELSTEQVGIINYAKDYKHDKLLINSVAGSSKTFTAVQIAKSTPGNHLYLAFNKAIQVEAQRDFPNYTECRTTASLAYKYAITQGLSLGNQSITKRVLGHFNWFNVNAKGNRNLQEKTVKAMEDFFTSKYELLDEFFTNRDYLLPVRKLVKQHALEMLSGRIPITFEFSMKMLHKLLASKSLALNYDYVILDECQDSSEVVLEIFKLINAKTHIAIGDPQQAIYASFVTNTVDAFTVLDWSTMSLSKSFRCSEEIAEMVEEYAFHHLDNRMVFKGMEYSIFQKAEALQNGSTAFISRTNAGLIKHMLELNSIGKKYNLIREPKDIFKLALMVLNLRNPKSKPEPKYKLLTSELAEWDSSHSLREQYKSAYSYIAAVNSEDIALCSAIRLVQSVGPGAIYSAYNQAKSNQELSGEHGYTLTSGHTSKGLCWDTVIIGDDFHSPLDKVQSKLCSLSLDQLSLNERELLRLIYVAITRARFSVLNTPNLN